MRKTRAPVRGRGTMRAEPDYRDQLPAIGPAEHRKSPDKDAHQGSVPRHGARPRLRTFRYRRFALKASVQLLTGCVALGLTLPATLCQAALPEAQAWATAASVPR